MPIYEYRCERGHSFEVLQRMADDPVSVCTSCDASVERVLHPVAVHFKGSGFYTTDYGRQGRKDSSGEPSETKADSGSRDSGTQSSKPEKAGAGKASASDTAGASAKGSKSSTPD